MINSLGLALAATLVMVVFSATGCASHIHAPADKALAEQAQKQLQAVVQAEQQRIAVMTANHKKVYDQETQAHRELDARAVAAISRRVLRLDWKQLRKDLGTGDKPGALVQSIIAARDALLAAVSTELAEGATRVGEVKDKEAQAQADLTAAQERVSRWNRRIAALEKLIEVAPTATALGEVKDLQSFRTTATGLAEKFRDEKVVFVDASGTTQTVRLADEVGDLLDSARAHIKGDREAGSILAGLSRIVTPEAPGLVITTAALAKDLAEAERNRALTRLSAAERRATVARRLDETARLATDLAANAAGIQDVGAFPDDEVVGTTLTTLSKAGAAPADASRPPRLQHALEAVQAYVTIAGPLTVRIRDARREDAFLQHVQSLEESAIAIGQHQVLISRGLEGLAAYHGGGFKPEQVADLLHKAIQLILLGVIAGGA